MGERGMKTVRKISTSDAMNTFATQQNLADALANKVANQLEVDINNHGCAQLSVSGGTTPKLFFQTLSRFKIDWSKVTICLVDERFVSPDDPRSNQRLIAINLLQNYAAKARFLPFYLENCSLNEAAAKAEQELILLDNPHSATIVGMGTDGHFASLFPNSIALADGLKIDGERTVIAVRDAPDKQERVSLTLTHILKSNFLALHIEGIDKKALITAKRSFENMLPIDYLLNQKIRPVDIFWAPLDL